MDCFSHYGRRQNSVGSASSVENLGKEEKKSTNGKRSGKVVKLSTDPQSVAARERRHRISDRFKILQSMVPGGTKMDTVSMLEEAIHYVKFLKTQIWLHQTMINFMDQDDPSLFLPTTSTTLPADQQSSPSLYALDNFTDHEVHSSSVPVPFGLPNSHFQAEETKPFDGTMNY